MDAQKPSKWLLIQGFLTLLMLIAGCQTARAELKCTFTSTPLVLDIGINTPPIVVTPGTPVGTTLYRDTLNIKARCSLNKLVGRTEHAYFNRMDLTDVPGNGLALYITYKGDRGKTARSIDTGIEVTNRHAAITGTFSNTWQEIPLQVEIEIIKERHVSNAVALKPLYTKIFSIDSTPPRGYDPARYYIRGAERISFKNQTCEIIGPRSFNVPMGSVSSTNTHGFGSGIGSTSAGKDFSLNLHCELSASGAFNIMMQMDGSPVSGFENAGVLALKSGKSAASGAGIQILHKSSLTPVTFAKPWQIGRFPLTDAVLSVSFLARYYQTENKVSPGTANSSLTYTISYL